MYQFKRFLMVVLLLLVAVQSFSQINEMWDKTVSNQQDNEKSQWLL